MGLVILRSSPHPPSVFLNVSHPFFILYSSSPALFCPCLFLSLYRTPNVSSNGNPGYESLPLTDRQSPPPSVSSSVPVTPSHSVPFFSLLLVLTLALITSSKRTNVVHFSLQRFKTFKTCKAYQEEHVLLVRICLFSSIIVFYDQHLSILKQKLSTLVVLKHIGRFQVYDTVRDAV